MEATADVAVTGGGSIIIVDEGAADTEEDGAGAGLEVVVVA